MEEKQPDQPKRTDMYKYDKQSTSPTRATGPYRPNMLHPKPRHIGKYDPTTDADTDRLPMRGPRGRKAQSSEEKRG